MKINYSGKTSVNDMFNCEICGHRGRDKYIATPSKEALVSWKELKVCKACARREMGTKNSKKWESIHG